MIRRVWVLCVAGIVLAAVPVAGANVPVPADMAQRALEAALSRQGDAYVWGGQFPGAFDCSGLIIWAYELVVPGFRIPDGRGGYVGDATMDHMWRYATERVPARLARPGDVVFITGEDGRITHGGLVISVSETEVKFVNASSYFGEVVVDTWPLDGTKRGQWVVGFGRLVVMPGRRPPMPFGASPWSLSQVAVPFAGTSSAFLRVSVSEDGLQSEVAVVQHLGNIRIGAGYWSWRDGWRDDQYIVRGDVAFGLVGASLPVGPVEMGADATYSEAGASYLGSVSVAWPIAGGEIRASAAYRHWAEDPWYSGPSISVAVTF